MPPARGCNECRSSRVKCDGERPVCARCRRLNLTCEGYRDAGTLIILNENERAERNAKRARRSPADTAGPSAVADAQLKDNEAQYIVPQRRLNQQQLPWLVPTLPRELQLDTRYLAVSRFLAHFTVLPNRHMGEDGYMADLPMLYSQSRKESALCLAVDACSLITFATATQSQPMQLESQKTYVDALSALRRATEDPVVAVKDETLTALLVLDHYSLLGDEDGSFLGPHAQGLAPILRLRGSQQIQSTVGWNLFRVAHRRMQIRKLFTGEEPLTESYDWIGALSPSHVESQLAANGLQIVGICSRTRQLLASDSVGLSEQQRITTIQTAITKLQAVECATSIWPQTLPVNWRPTDCAPAPDMESNPLNRDTPRSQTYEDIWVATSLNWHRMLQVGLHQALADCWQALGDTTGAGFSELDLAGMSYSQKTAASLIDDMLASVPFLTGKIDAHGRIANGFLVKELGIYFAYVALKMILATSLASEAQCEVANTVLRQSVELWKHGGGIT